MSIGGAFLERRDVLRAVGGSAALSSTALTKRDTMLAIQGSALLARDFGTRFDGRLDDTLSLQRAIDEAARQGRALVLPSGTALLTAPLDLRRRNVALIGDPVGNTILKAGRPLSCILNAEEEKEVIDSPLFLYGLTIDGAGTTETGLRLRFRHRTVLDTVAFRACETGVYEKDTWLGRRTNCQIRGVKFGCRLIGANHSSVWAGCSFSDARQVHIEIGADGTAKDGNDALLFQSCDVEFGSGDGVIVAAGATATFDTCYLGEGIGGDVLRNAGQTSLRGGALYVGYSPDRVGVRALAGSVRVDGVSVRGQQYGSLDRLVSGGARHPAGRTGQATFRDIDTHLALGGNPCLPGDMLGSLAMKVFAPKLGRNWQPVSEDVRLQDTSIDDRRRLRCVAQAGTNPILGFSAQLTGQSEARRSGNMYLVIVYAATKPLDLKLTGGAISRAPWFLVGTLPATNEASTYIKVDLPSRYESHTAIELTMKPSPGDEITLYHASVSDASVSGPGLLANLGKAA